MALLPPIIQDFQIRPDVSKLHAVASVLEKHIGALRADLERFLEPEAAPEVPSGPVPESSLRPDPTLSPSGPR